MAFAGESYVIVSECLGYLLQVVLQIGRPFGYGNKLGTRWKKATILSHYSKTDQVIQTS